MTAVKLPTAPFLRSISKNHPLRVGLRLDGEIVSASAASVLTDLSAANFIEIVGVEFVHHAARQPRSLACVAGNAIFKLLDRVYKLENDPFLPTRIPEHLTELKTGMEVDVLLDLTSTTAVHVGPAKFGTWKLHLGTGLGNEGWPPFAKEIVRNDLVRRVELRQHVEPHATGMVLCRADFSFNPHLSARANARGPIWGGCHFFLQKLHELHRRGFLSVHSDESDRARIRSSPPAFHELLGWATSQILQRLRRRARRPVPSPRWQIAIRQSEEHPLSRAWSLTLDSFRWMDEMSSQSVADPFLLSCMGRIWLFFELIEKDSGLGHIACGWLDESGRLRDQRSVLKMDTHLSYPHLIQDGANIYMLPETAASGGLDLYRARKFPDVWEKVCRLLDFPCVDSTVFKRDGAWWMFTSPMVTPGDVAIAWIFKAENLAGPWEFQFSSPRSSTARTARGAGEFFELDDRLFRPSQDCSVSYGKSFSFNEVTHIDGDRYEEKEVYRFDPELSPDFVGFHTFNRLGEWEVIDGYVRGDTPR